MGLLNEAGSAFLKFSERVVERTEDYTKIARLFLEIRRLEDESSGIEREIGRTALSKKEGGATSMDLADGAFTVQADRIMDIKAKIARKREEIDSLRFARRGNYNDEI